MHTIYHTVIEATGAQLREAIRERREFKADRWGHNNPHGGYAPRWSRIKYMTHDSGYVMARRPHCSPFVISEKLWRSFELFDKSRHQER